MNIETATRALTACKVIADIAHWRDDAWSEYTAERDANTAAYRDLYDAYTAARKENFHTAQSFFKGAYDVWDQALAVYADGGADACRAFALTTEATFAAATGETYGSGALMTAKALTVTLWPLNQQGV